MNGKKKSKAVRKVIKSTVPKAAKIVENEKNIKEAKKGWWKK